MVHNNMVRLSIIVPIYNVEQYVEQCIRSLYNQDILLEEYEVICVDDCSPDGSRKIVEKLQKEYTSLHLITNAVNRKLGGARNAGLDVAKGKYIWFVDSDDYIAPRCLGNILAALEEDDLELVQFDVCEFNERDIIMPQIQYEDKKTITGVEFVLDKQRGDWSHYRCPVAWNKVYSKEFLVQNHFRFVEHLMYEDTDLSLYMFPFVKRMKHLNIVGYYHRINIASVTQVKVTGEILYFKIMQQHRCVRAYLNAPNQEYKDLVKTYIHRTLTEYRKELKELSYKELITYIMLVYKHNIRSLRPLCTWKTWLAINYGITCFVR